MKKISLFLLTAAVCLTLAGCNKDSEVNAFMSELDSTTEEMVAKIDANPSSAGIDEAQKVYDSHKPELQKKWDAIKGARGFQVSEDMKNKLTENVKKNVTSLSSTMMKNAMKLGSDPAARDKFQKLLKDYQDTFRP
ncbi:MAG: hypothetical protein R2747_00215 [Pyrinomonadaceae bacterium]